MKIDVLSWHEIWCIVHKFLYHWPPQEIHCHILVLFFRSIFSSLLYTEYNFRYWHSTRLGKSYDPGLSLWCELCVSMFFMHVLDQCLRLYAVCVSRPLRDLQNSWIWPTTENSCILQLLQNAMNLTTFIHWCLNNSINCMIQHRNVHNSIVWRGHSGQYRAACVLVNHWQTDANYWSCWILACCYDLVSQTVE